VLCVRVLNNRPQMATVIGRRQLFNRSRRVRACACVYVSNGRRRRPILALWLSIFFLSHTAVRACVCVRMETTGHRGDGRLRPPAVDLEPPAGVCVCACVWGTVADGTAGWFRAVDLELTPAGVFVCAYCVCAWGTTNADYDG
jgi:hypothetical protein